MKQLRIIGTCLILSVLLSAISACSSDDDDPVDLNSYIVGTWRSYKGTVYYLGETSNVQIDKTGAMSMAYFEINFKKDGSLTFGYWDPVTPASWEEEPATYSIKGDMVTVIDSEGEKGDFVFKDRNLYLTQTITQEGYPMTITIQLRK